MIYLINKLGEGIKKLIGSLSVLRFLITIILQNLCKAIFQGEILMAF